MAIRPETPNVLLVIADDLGQDVVDLVEIDSRPTLQVHTVDLNGVDIVGELPNLGRLLRNGLYFQQAWAQPACSPTRASIYTGLHPWKHGVGSPMGTPTLDSGAGFRTLPSLLPRGYVSGLFGKWHLGSTDGARPTDHGFHRHVGTLGGVLPDYFVWTQSDSVKCYDETAMNGHDDPLDYATTRTVLEASRWINEQRPEDPWFAVVAFHSPHDPFHVPPGGYDPATPGDPAPPDPDVPAHHDYLFNLMAQNMDFNLGRLLHLKTKFPTPWSIAPIPLEQLANTLVVFIGDNGSPRSVAREEHKTEIYEYGVRIPMIIADGQALVDELEGRSPQPRFLHPSRLGGTTRALSHVVDLYMTIVRMVNPQASGFPPNTDSRDLSGLLRSAAPGRGLLDGVPGPGGSQPSPVGDSAAPVRMYNFSQWFDEDDDVRATIRNARYKLNWIQGADPEYSLYEYADGEIPDREDENAINLYDAAVDRTDPDASAALELLVRELRARYRRDPSRDFPALYPGAARRRGQPRSGAQEGS